MRDLRCAEFSAGLREMARGGPAIPHVTDCAACRVELARQKRLQAALRVVAAEVAETRPPARVEQTLAARVETIRYRRRRWMALSAAGALAAALAIAWFAMPRHVEVTEVRKEAKVVVPSRPAKLHPTENAAAIPPVAKHRTKIPVPKQQPFVAIPYSIPLGPYERADVMRVEIPVAALIAAGLPMGMADPGAQARADLLVGQDGRARAVRLLAVSMPN